MGKRVDKSARTVIGPDPTLKVNEIAVPTHIASILTFPVIVNRYNIDSLQKSLYDQKINYVIRKGTSNRINMKYALYTQGTKLRYGDYVVRNGKYELIKNERQLFFLKEGDVVIRNGEQIKDVVYPKQKEFILQIGDTVERKLQDGDIVLLNRQPTLHMGSMQAFNIIVREGRQIRTNLSVTKSFNADYDGDKTASCLQQAATV
jgi:DNA-directed RNA polymerase beta' subunit